jgi:hypothetical protein
MLEPRMATARVQRGSFAPMTLWPGKARSCFMAHHMGTPYLSPGASPPSGARMRTASPAPGGGRSPPRFGNLARFPRPSSSPVVGAGRGARPGGRTLAVLARDYFRHSTSNPRVSSCAARRSRPSVQDGGSLAGNDWRLASSTRSSSSWSTCFFLAAMSCQSTTSFTSMLPRVALE